MSISMYDPSQGSNDSSVSTLVPNSAAKWGPPAGTSEASFNQPGITYQNPKPSELGLPLLQLNLSELQR